MRQASRSPHDICSHNGPNRTAYLNATYLFQKQHPISIWEVFSGSASARSDFARDDIRLRLKEGVQGDDCVHGSYNDCMRCFSRVRASIGRLSDAYAVFSKTLHRFDCMQAVDTATATRPFSPNGSCEHCKTWYGRWLLVHLVDVWERPPCINWCYYAQLACPHLATSKVVDYAGHPSFQCRDMHIPVGDALDAYSCNCVHPCDVRGVVSLNTSSRAGNKRSGNDFFAANEHCNARRRSCKNTAHDRMRTGNAGLRSSTNEALRPSIATTTQLLLASLLIGMRLIVGLALFCTTWALNCPNNSQEFNGYCYQALTSLPSDYDTADSYCAKKGMANSHLASVMNMFENLFIARLLPAGAQAYLGAKQVSNNTYAWADGLPFAFNNIDTTKPSGGDCLLLDKDSGKWLRVDCSRPQAFVCQITATDPPVISNNTQWKDAANYLLRGMDPTANPCEDFYQFTCGTYLNNTILNGRPRIGVYGESQTHVNNDTARALDSVTSSSSLTERITKAAYQACVYNYGQDNVDDKSKQIYTEMTNAFGIPELPLFMDPTAMFSIPSTQIWSAVGYYEGTHALGSLLFSWSTVDYQNITQNALFMNQPGLPLPRDYYVLPQFLTIMEAHVQEYAQLISMWAKALGKTVKPENIQQIAADAVNFEIAIALASWPDEEQRNYKQMYNPYTLNKLMSAYPTVEWTAYLNKLLQNAGLTSNIFSTDEVIVSQPSYFAWLNSLFAGKQFPSSTIVNWISIQALYDSADFLAGDFLKLAEENNRLPYLMQHGVGLTRVGAREGRRKFDDIGDMCLDLIMAYMPYGPGYVYVKQVGETVRQATVKDVSQQTTNIIDSFKGMIDTLGWMTPGSKSNAYIKAAGLIKNVGWPDMFKDFKDTSDLDKYHQDYAPIADLDQTKFWDIQKILKAGMETRESLRPLSEPADRKNFIQSPAMVNAWYQPERNSITFPFAAFNAPYYNLNWPQAFNYGGQGGTGGHELTHGYDDEGVQFGPDGSLSNCDAFHCGWMDMNSTSGFTDMAQASFLYSTQCCPVKTGNVHCANGATTQGENIADLGGQEASYRAYRKYVKETLGGVEEPRLPGLEEYTPNQIFWITYGFSWCMKQSTDSLVKQMLTNPHAPASCRTNNVMQDIPEFGVDFSCPRGSTMYPQDNNRCKVWVGA
ncbi:unnamed protein product, partial [Mesorhabditis spiculigera]